MMDLEIRADEWEMEKAFFEEYYRDLEMELQNQEQEEEIQRVKIW